jgi:Tfp pilus assembly protein PilZ
VVAASPKWCFTGRVAHVEPLGAMNDKLGVGVQFIYYEVPRASI